MLCIREEEVWVPLTIGKQGMMLVLLLYKHAALGCGGRGVFVSVLASVFVMTMEMKWQNHDVGAVGPTVLLYNTLH